LQKGLIALTTLWCGLGGYTYYPREDQKADTERFLDRCAETGIRSLRFYSSFSHSGETAFRLWRPGEQSIGEPLAIFELYGERRIWDPFGRLVTGAHGRGMEIWGYTSPNYQGALQQNPHSLSQERLPFLYLEPYANRHPEFWVRDRQGLDGLTRQGYVILSLAFAKVRHFLVARLHQLVAEAGLDGLELEWLVGAEPESPYGFEAPSVDGVQSTTRFVHQVRRELKGLARLSAAVPADAERARRWMLDWPDWGRRQLVDHLVLRLRGRDQAVLGTQVRAAREACGHPTWLIAQLDCWHVDGFRDGSDLVRAAAAARAAGADEVGVYRADAVEAASLWPAVAEIE
jgi:hypothetical protein